MNAADIGMLDETPRDYAKALTAARTLADLTAVVNKFAYVAEDARRVVARIMVEDFATFRTGLDMERAGMFAGEYWNDRYAAVLMPAVLVQVTMIAKHFKLPWGAAFHRCRDTGLIHERNGVAVWRGMHGTSVEN